MKLLIELQRRDIDFRISVLGQGFAELPSAITTIRSLFGDKIETWGFQKSRKSYWRALSRGDIFISTAQHEFFGISAAEAIIAGLFPLLPARLAYPELIESAVSRRQGEIFLYDGSVNDAATRIEGLSQQRDWREKTKATSIAEALRAKLDWKVRATSMDDALLKTIRCSCALDVIRFRNRSLAGSFAGVERADWLKKHHLDLARCFRFVLDSSWHNKELTRGQ